jgi:hypothetical protein
MFRDTRTGDLYEGDIDDLVFVKELGGYVHSDDVHTSYSDDSISDISIYHEVERQLDPQIMVIANLLEAYHPKGNEIHMEDLAILLISELETNSALNQKAAERRIRKIINQIKTERILVIGHNSRGYYVAKTEDEIMEVAKVHESYLRTHLETYYSYGIQNKNWLYNEMKRLEAKYKPVLPNQISTDEKKRD